MVTRIFNQEDGSALLFLLTIIALIGLFSGIAGSSWQTIVQRSKEEDLLFKGGQIRNGIKQYYEFNMNKTGSKTHSGIFPKSLKDLLVDTRTVNKTRYLRSLYSDPMTGGDWEVIKDKSGGIMGVFSSSEKVPFRQQGFSDEYQNFNGKISYQEWKFVYQPKMASTIRQDNLGDN